MRFRVERNLTFCEGSILNDDEVHTIKHSKQGKRFPDLGLSSSGAKTHLAAIADTKIARVNGPSTLFTLCPNSFISLQKCLARKVPTLPV